ncbi:MAG: DUF1501 domain-containing protein, partial [Candidatus Omnitrophica bacterium]|nr:DUF1501 domain-containing protein [Candidatus Omnitrophota bacterium]
MNHHPFDPENVALSRRDFLLRSGMGFGALGLGLETLTRSGPAHAIYQNPLASKNPPFEAKAKQVVHIFLNGGCSHVDTFDPKPTLDKYHGKELPTKNLKTERPTGAAFKSPFTFKQYGESGIPVSEIFEKTAAHVDDLCIIRSMHADVPNHEPSLLLMNCGAARMIRPSVG